ncbi:hypothetical protein K9M06_00030 [Candidatus Bipolaricaulota bacterium]|nr:hypothetical protein [Candidatus Bipolaricaulota bacterium]
MKTTSKLFVLLLVSVVLLLTSGTIGIAAEDISPAVPSIASFILPGAGQFINDQPNKALTHFVVGVGIYSAYSLPFIWKSPLIRILPALNLAWSGYSAYDAYRVAEEKNRSIFDSSLNSNSEPVYSVDLVDSSLELSTGAPELSVSSVSETRQ